MEIPGSISWYIDPKYMFLSVLGSLLLYLCYQVLKLFLRTLKKNKCIQKNQARVTKRRKSGLFKGRRTCQRETEEGRKLLSILQRPLGQHSDTTHFRKLLCPDPLCEVCNRTTAKVSRLLSRASLEDASDSLSHESSRISVKKSSLVLSPIGSAVPPRAPIVASLPELCLPLPSSLSPDQATPLPDLLSHSPMGDALPPEPVPPLSSKCPVDGFQPQPPDPTPPSPHHSQEAKSVLQPEDLLSPVDSHCRSSNNVPTTRGIYKARLTMPKFFRQQPHAENLPPSKLEHSGDNKELLDLHSTEASFGGDITANLVNPGSLSFLSPDVLTCLERQVKKRSHLVIQKEKEKKKYFPKELKPDSQLNCSDKMLQSGSHQQDSPLSLPLQSCKGILEEMQGHHQLPYPKPFEVPKCIQFFWGLPRLRSESLNPTVPVLGDNLTCANFSKIFNATTVYKPNLSQHKSHLTPQDQFQSSSPILFVPPPCQISTCGVCVHKFQDEALSLKPAQIQNLEYNILQKGQESMWGLPSVIQNSKDNFCPPAPSVLLVSQSSKVCVRLSILPGDFPLQNELRKKLEHHLQKRLIQHRWGLPRRVHKSLSKMNPQKNVPESLDSKSSYGLSWIALNKSQSRKLDLSQPRSFQEKNSEVHSVEETEKKGYSPEADTKDPSTNPKAPPDSGLGSNSLRNLKNQLDRILGKSTKTLQVSSSQKQLKDALEVHLGKKYTEIRESQMPCTVHRCWHSMDQILKSPEKSSSQTKNIDLASPVNEDNHLNTSQDISFLGSSKQKMLEDHIKLFHKRMMCGLPHKVQESIDTFNLKGTPSWSSLHSNLPSSSSLNSWKDSKIGVPKPLQRSSNTVHEDKVGTTNPVPILDDDLPAISLVSIARQEVLRCSPLPTDNEHTENVKTIQDDRLTILPYSNKDRPEQTIVVNRCSPTLPIRQAGARPKSGNEEMSPSDNKEKSQQNMIKDLEGTPLTNKSREIFKAKELCALLSQSNSTITEDSESSLESDIQKSKVNTILNSARPPQGRPLPKDSESLHLNNQLLNELKFKMECRENTSAPGPSTNLSLALDHLTSKTLLIQDKRESGGDPAASHVLQVHFGNRGSSTKQEQKETWIPKYDLSKCQEKNFPTASKRECPLASKTCELGGGDAGLGTCQPRRRSHQPQDNRTFKEAIGSKSSQAQSQKEQPSPENLFRNQIKHLFQRIYSSKKVKGQESSVEKSSSSSSSVQGPNLVKKRSDFTRNSEAQKIVTDLGKVLEEKLAGSHRVEDTCPPKALSSHFKSEKIQQKVGLCVEAQLIQEHPFNFKASSSKMSNAKSYSQEVVGQNYRTNNMRLVKDRDRQPQQAVTLQDKPLYHRHPPLLPHRETMLQPGPSSRCRIGQVAPVAPNYATTTMFGKLSLYLKRKGFSKI